jgi:ferritin-like metal-binding protein YciE
MGTPQADLMGWLSDAHAMEMQAIQLLENQARRIETYPELHRRIVEHLEETRGQLEKLERCIEDRGGTPSTLKDAGAIFMANMQALAVLSWPMRSSRAVS